METETFKKKFSNWLKIFWWYYLNLFKQQDIAISIRLWLKKIVFFDFCLISKEMSINVLNNKSGQNINIENRYGQKMQSMDSEFGLNEGKSLINTDKVELVVWLLFFEGVEFLADGLAVLLVRIDPLLKLCRYFPQLWMVLQIYLIDFILQ